MILQINTHLSVVLLLQQKPFIITDTKVVRDG